MSAPTSQPEVSANPMAGRRTVVAAASVAALAIAIAAGYGA